MVRMTAFVLYVEVITFRRDFMTREEVIQKFYNHIYTRLDRAITLDELCKLSEAFENVCRAESYCKPDTVKNENDDVFGLCD